MRASARHTDPVTSHMAAAEIEAGGKAQAQRETVLSALSAFPGCTSAEIAEYAKLDRHMVARRLPELRVSKQATKGNIRECRAHGTMAATWWPAGRQT